MNVSLTPYERLAEYLNFPVYRPDLWPIETFERLLKIEKEHGHEEMRREITRMMTP